MKRIRTALLFTLITLSLTVMPLFAEEEQAPSPSDGSYHLEQVVVLSRHNIRAPLSNSGSAVGQLTPYAWTEWTAPDSELTLKGGVTDYELPETIERRTPIGVKLVFEKWMKDEEEFARVRLIYQSTEQLRHLTPLSLDNPPMAFTIELPGLEMNEDGYYQLDDVTGALQSAIDSYDMLSELYADDAELENAA